jgi:hypothetical protein
MPSEGNPLTSDDLGRIAYEAYHKAHMEIEGRRYVPEPWDDLPSDVRERFCRLAETMRCAILNLRTSEDGPIDLDLLVMGMDSRIPVGIRTTQS